MADLYEDPAQALAWDIRALDAVDALTDQRVQEHHAALQVARFYPSLHLNLADNYRRLGPSRLPPSTSARPKNMPRTCPRTLTVPCYGSQVTGTAGLSTTGLSIGLEPIPTMPDGPSDTHTQQRDSAN